jgi:hypothetical protein
MTGIHGKIELGLPKLTQFFYFKAFEAGKIPPDGGFVAIPIFWDSKVIDAKSRSSASF